MSNKKLPSLEDSLNEIATLVTQMEKSDLTLDKSLLNFERGISLVKHCQKILSEAEQKVQILMQTNSQENLVPFTEATMEKGLGNEDNQC